MHVNSLLVAPLLVVAGVHADVTLNLHHDNDCRIPVPGSGWDYCVVWHLYYKCRHGLVFGEVVNNAGSPAGTLTFYNRNNCAAAQPSHGYSSAYYACLNNFGFVANAVGLAG